MTNIQNQSGGTGHGQIALETGRRTVAPAARLRDTVRRLTYPRCPDCRKRGMICRYTLPESYREPSPRYYQCDFCAARYFRMATGPWFSAAGPEFAHCYGTNP
jgi:hypothetical protein